MAAFVQAATRNCVLARIPGDELLLVTNKFEFFTLPARSNLFEPLQAADHVYFLEAGVISRVICSSSGDEVECAMIGPEGMAPAEAALGIDTVADRLMMPLGGSGWRLPRNVYERLLETSSALREITNYYIAVLMMQMRHTSVSNVLNSVEVRLARWLMMCADRVEGDVLEITQEFISTMLAVRRPTVTEALHALELRGLIALERGRVRVLDHSGLTRMAGEYYGQPEKLYRTVIGPMPFDGAREKSLQARQSSQMQVG